MKTFFKKLGAFFIGPLGAAVLSFLLTTTITHIITPDEYGRSAMFQTSQSIVSLFALFGLHQAYAREYVLAKGAEKNTLLISAMALPLALSLLLSAALLIFRSRASELLFGSTEETFAIFLTALTFPCMILDTFCLQRIRMGEQGLLYSALTILLKILTLLLAIPMLLWYEQSFRSVVYAMAIAQILSSTVSSSLVLRNIPIGTRPNRTVLFNLLKYAAPLVPTTLISWIYTSSDQLMLRTISSYSELGLYTAAHKIATIVSIMEACFTVIWPPIAFRWYASRKDSQYFDLVMWAVGLFSTGIGLGLLLCKDVVALVLGNSFCQAIAVFPFLLLQPVMYTMSESSTMGISFSRKTGYNIIVSGVTAVANVILNLSLIPIWGGRGAAIATGLSYILFFWMRTLISRKLWRPFPLLHFVGNTFVLLINCCAHTFLQGSIPYLISGASIAALTVVNLPKIKKTWSLLRALDA